MCSKPSTTCTFNRTKPKALRSNTVPCILYSSRGSVFQKGKTSLLYRNQNFSQRKLKSISIVQLSHKTIVHHNPKKISSISKHPIEETTADKYSFRSTQIVFISKASQFWPTKNRVKKNLLDKAKESPVQETIYYPNGLEQQSQKRQISDRK